MTKKQDNKLSMAKTVQLVLDKDAAIINSIPAFKTANKEFNTCIQGIITAAEQQENNIKGFAKDKKLKRRAAMEQPRVL